MEHVVYALHSILQRALVADVTYIKLDLVGHFGHTGLEIVTHVVLLLLVAGEDADLTDVGAQKAVQNRIAKTTGASGDEEGFVFEY